MYIFKIYFPNYPERANLHTYFWRISHISDQYLMHHYPGEDFKSTRDKEEIRRSQFPADVFEAVYKTRPTSEYTEKRIVSTKMHERGNIKN